MCRIKEIYRVLESIPDAGDAILIGGQALNLWAGYYAQQESSLFAYSPFYSHDIDFLGDEFPAAEINHIWKGEMETQGQGSHAPVVTTLKIKLEDGRTVRVNIQEMFIGLGNFDIGEDAQKVRCPNTHKPILALHHPAHCLDSRIYNTYGILNRLSNRPDGRRTERIRLAIEVLTQPLSDLFRTQDGESRRTAVRLIEYVANLAAEDPVCHAYRLDNIDVLDAIPSDPEPNMPENFLSEHFTRIRSYVARKRERYSDNFEVIMKSVVSAPDEQSDSTEVK